MFEAEFGIVSDSYYDWCGVDCGRLPSGLPVQPTCETQVFDLHIYTGFPSRNTMLLFSEAP